MFCRAPARRHSRCQCGDPGKRIPAGAELYQAHGGELSRMSVARAAPVGRFCGWKSLMPVTIWSVTKPALQGA